jgi:hypothetical protein
MKKIKKKRIVLFALFFVLFLLIVVLFRSFVSSKEEESTLERTYIFEDLENYSFDEKGNDVFVENSDLGFSFNISKEWNIKESEMAIFSEEYPEKALLFLSPSYKESEYEDFTPQSGCKMYISVCEEENYFNSLSESIKDVVDGYVQDEMFTVVDIGGINSAGYGINSEHPTTRNSVVVPTEGKVYEIGVFFAESDEDFCKKSFNDLLKSISYYKKDEK